MNKWLDSADRLLVLRRIKSFDIVLGINWLLRYYAITDCESQVIVFHELGQKEFVYRAYISSLFDMTVSTPQANKLMGGRCVA